MKKVIYASRKRFDRTAEAKKIHFASSMSLLGLKDGDNAQDGYHVDSGADRQYEASWVLKW